MGPDGSAYSWPDGELVTPDKLAAWLKEELLLRRVPVRASRPPGRRQRTAAARQLQQEQAEAEALLEAQELALKLEVPLAEVAELLAEDREGYVPPAGLEGLQDRSRSWKGRC